MQDPIPPSAGPPESGSGADEQDFARFYYQSRAAVLNAVNQMLGDWQTAEDVVQEAYLELHQRLKQSSGIQNLRGYFNVLVYNRCMRRLGRGKSRLSPTEEDRLTHLVDRESMDAASEEAPFGPVLGDQLAWNGLAYWGRRIFEVATAHVSTLQKQRLAVLLQAGSRLEALDELRRHGGEWSKSAASMALVRYSERVDASLRSIFAAGPRDPLEEAHWLTFLELRRLCPGLGPQTEARESTLSWFIRGLNGLEPKERHELVGRILRTSGLTSAAVAGEDAVPL